MRNLYLVEWRMPQLGQSQKSQNSFDSKGNFGYHSFGGLYSPTIGSIIFCGWNAYLAMKYLFKNNDRK